MDSFWLNCQRKVWSPRHVWNLIEYEMECVINVALSSYKCCRSRNNCLFNFVIFDGSINQQNLIPDNFLNLGVHKYRVHMWYNLEITIWQIKIPMEFFFGFKTTKFYPKNISTLQCCLCYYTGVPETPDGGAGAVCAVPHHVCRERGGWRRGGDRWRRV